MFVAFDTARTVLGKWLMARVYANGVIVAEFTGGGIARARFNPEPFDLTEGMLYDRPVWEALSTLRQPGLTWLDTVDYSTRIYVTSRSCYVVSAAAPSDVYRGAQALG